MKASDNLTTALHGQRRLLDVDNYLDERLGFSLVVCIDYDCEAYHEKIKDAFTRLHMPSMPHNISVNSKPYFRVLQHDGPIANAVSERLQLSESLEKALRALHGQNADVVGEWDLGLDLIYPYSKLYHSKDTFIEPSVRLLESQQQIDLEVLFRYVTERLTLDYEELAELSAQGIVNQKHWLLLFRSGDTVITEQDGQLRGFSVNSCRSLNQNTLELDCWSWGYDGNFSRNFSTIPISWPSRSKQLKITDLSVYPIRYAADGIESKLRERGHTFWGCRRRKYVNYDVPLHGLGSQLVRILPQLKWALLIHPDESAVHGRHGSVQVNAWS
jgi:hypothetical protein